MAYVISNWKMYPTREEARELFHAVQAGLEGRFGPGGPPLKVILCPPFVSLPELHAMRNPRLVALGAQNCHWESHGPYTGEISPAMLRGLVDYVLIGHSERRAAGETDEQIARKVGAAAGAGLTPILFVGEDERAEGAIDQTERRLIDGLACVDLASQQVLIVYEPTWAIGAEEPAQAEHVRGAVERLKTRLGHLKATRSEVIYGGTVNAGNVEQFAALAGIDGVGATRAGLDADEFLRIVDRVARAGAEGTASG